MANQRIIYTDSLVGADGGLLNTSPAATYKIVDLSTILDRINDGVIKCGTGKPYPVNWEDNDENEIPWYR